MTFSHPLRTQSRKSTRRAQQRRAVALGMLLALGLVSACGEQHASRPGDDPSSGKTSEARGTAAVRFTFRGNGIGSATFGQPETTAIAELDKILGSPATR